MITLHPDETITLIQRKHWYVIATQGATLVMAAIVPLIVLAALFQSSTGDTLREYWEYVLLGTSTWLMVLWMLFFILWTNYYLDALIITDRRLIDVEQHGLFARDKVDVPLGRVQDIKVEIKGFLPTMMDFGTLHVQTAGQSAEVIIPNIAEPHEVQKIISGRYHSRHTAHTTPRK